MIQIDMNKAKEIGHSIRRQKREEEFAPLDELATIPMYAADAELRRQVVREKYALVQDSIESAETPEGIKLALSKYD